MAHRQPDIGHAYEHPLTYSAKHYIQIGQFNWYAYLRLNRINTTHVCTGTRIVRTLSMHDLVRLTEDRCRSQECMRRNTISLRFGQHKIDICIQDKTKLSTSQSGCYPFPHGMTMIGWNHYYNYRTLFERVCVVHFVRCPLSKIICSKELHA